MQQVINKIKNTLGAIDYSIHEDWVMLQFDKTDKHLALDAMEIMKQNKDILSVTYEEESGYHFATGWLVEAY